MHCHRRHQGKRAGWHRALLSGALVAAILATGGAQARGDGTRAPEAVVHEAFQEALDALMEHHEAIAEDPSVAARLIEDILGPHLDFDLMARLILGRYWREATPGQRERFTRAFREHSVRVYARALSDHVDRAVALVRDDPDILRIRGATSPDERGRVTVRASLHTGNTPVPLQFRLIRRNDTDWRAYDIVIENLSLLANYRQEYTSIIRREGVDGLIRRLEDR